MMDRLKSSVLAILVLQFCVSSSAETLRAKPVLPELKIVSGLYSTDLPDPIWYDAYAPVIFEFKTPKFNQTEVTFNNWYRCTNEKYPYALSCPTVFHLNTAIKYLHIDFESIRPGSGDEETSQEKYFFKLGQHENFCQVIQDHFPEFYIRDSDYATYLGQLSSCSSGMNGIQMLKNITDFKYNIRQPFSKMESNFYETFYKPVTGSNQTLQRLLGSAVLSNSRTAIQGSVMASFYAERNRWNFATLHCFMKQLPPSLVNEDKLNEILKNLTRALSDTFYDLALPQRTLAKYYQFPLTDCTHTRDDLVIRLLVPLIGQAPVDSSTSDQESPYVLRTLHTSRFVVKDKFCEMTPELDGTRFIYHSVYKIAYRTSCKPNELCDVSLNSRTGKEDACVSNVFAGNTQGVLDYCSFSCHPIPKMENQTVSTRPLMNKKETRHRAMIRRIGNNRIILASSTGFSAGDLLCTIENGTELLYNLLPQWQMFEDGGIEIEMMCKCRLYVAIQPVNGDRFSTVTLNSMMGNVCNSSRISYRHFATLPWDFVDVESLERGFNFTGSSDASPIFSLQTNVSLSDLLKDVLSNTEPPIGNASPMSSNDLRPANVTWIWLAIVVLALLVAFMAISLIVLYKKLLDMKDLPVFEDGERSYSVSYSKDTEMTEQLIQ